jgi:hypothetical protein
VVITVPADIPPGDFYVILIQNTPSDSFSPIFTIIDPITPTQITPTLSSTKPTVPTLSSDTPKPTSYDPSEGDSKSNGAAIGGGIAGVVIVIVAVVMLSVFRKRQRRRSRHLYSDKSVVDPQPDYVLPSVEDTRGNVFLGNLQTEPTTEAHVSSMEVQPTRNPHGIPSSIQLQPEAPLETKSITPSMSSSLSPSIPILSLNPQGHTRGPQQRQIGDQEQPVLQRSPQHISTDNPFQEPNSRSRSPEEVNETAPPSNIYELQKQIISLQAELNLLQDRLNS